MLVNQHAYSKSCTIAPCDHHCPTCNEAALTADADEGAYFDYRAVRLLLTVSQDDVPDILLINWSTFGKCTSKSLDGLNLLVLIPAYQQVMAALLEQQLAAHCRAVILQMSHACDNKETRNCCSHN